MTYENIPFPRRAKKFFLNSWFATELCFPEFTCCPEILARTLEAASKGLPLPNPFPDDGFVDISSYVPNRFLAYNGVGCKGTTQFLPAISNGVVWMPVPLEGLFESMLRAAERAYGKPVKPLLFPDPPDAPFDSWVGSYYSILHDTVAQTAALVTSEQADNYMKLRPAKS